jgi:hypothetical protein
MSKFLLLFELLLKMNELSLKLPLLLIQMILALPLLGLKFSLVMHLHLQLLSCQSLLMCLHSLFLFLDKQVDGDFLCALNRFEVILVLGSEII